MLNKIVNFILFNALWPACVLGAAHNMIWPGLVLVFGLLVWQLSPPFRHVGDFRLALTCCLVGMCLDTTWLQLGWLDYSTNVPNTGVAPVWIAFLWIGFGFSINHSMSWLLRFPRFGPLFIGLTAPITYLTAERLGAVQWAESRLLIYSCIGLSWGLFLYGLLYLAKYWREGSPSINFKMWRVGL